MAILDKESLPEKLSKGFQDDGLILEVSGCVVNVMTHVLVRERKRDISDREERVGPCNYSQRLQGNDHKLKDNTASTYRPD